MAHKNDSQVSLREAMSWVEQFCTERGWDPFHNPKDLAIGLVTEASELLELFRFVNEQDVGDLINDPDLRIQIADELADSLYFILRFAQLYDFSLSDSLRNKLVKTAKKYPAPS